MKKLMINLVLVMAASSLPDTAVAQSFDGMYTLIRPAQPTETPGKIEVVEVFSYACPGCYMFEPVISKWREQAPDKVEFRRLPAVFNNGWGPLGQAYYTAEKLGVLDQLHPLIFQAIHKDKRQVFTDDEIRAFFVEMGIDETTFNTAYNSMDVKTRMRKSEVMVKKYKVPSTPSIVINGKYLVQPSRTKGDEGLYAVMDYLIGKELQNP